jgi:hypothetical protein
MRRCVPFLSLLLLVACSHPSPQNVPVPAPADRVAIVAADTASVRITPLSPEEADVVAGSMVYLAVHEGAQQVALLERDLEAGTPCSVDRTAFQMVHPRDDERTAQRIRDEFAHELEGESLIVGRGEEPMGRNVLHLVIGVRCSTIPFVP